MSKELIKNINKILKNIFSNKILKFTYLGKCKLKKMSDYNFMLYEFNVMLDNYSNYTVFIKIISKNEIKETLFYYWKFCEENYNSHDNFYFKKANIQNTSLKDEKEYIQKYSMQLLSKNNKIWKISDINIINLKEEKTQMNFIKYYEGKIINNYNTKEYLFVGII